MFRYINRISIAFSILINVIFGGRNNQTFSARNWHWKRSGKPNLVGVIDLIFFWEKNHCLDSWVKWTIINNSINSYNESMGFSKSRNIWE